MILIYTTCRNTEEATKLASILLKEKLASCVNLWPVQSIHRTEDEQITSELEAVLMIKTMEPKLTQIERLIEKNHSYSTPYVGAIDVRRFNRTYREWMTRVISP